MAFRGRRHHLPAPFNHIPLAKTLSIKSKKHQATKRFANVRRAFDNSPARYGVISAEHFEYVAPESLRAAIEQHLPEHADRIRLVAYVRPHADRMLAAFVERSKLGTVYGSLEAFHETTVETQMLFYAPRFEKWQAVFGDRFTLRPFVRDRLYREDVVQDFFRYLFQGEAFEITGPTRENESLTVEDIAMLRATHRHLRAIDGNHRQLQSAFGSSMAGLLGAEPNPVGGTKPQLHKALAERLITTYAEDAATLDAAFFDGSPMLDALMAAPTKTVDQAQSYRVKSHFSAPAQRQFKVWAQLLHQMMAADPTHFEWAVRTPKYRSGEPPSGSRF